jgi:type II secretory pathway component PulM
VNDWIARIRAAVAGLERRERMLVLTAGGLLVIALLYALVVNPLLGLVSNTDVRRDAAEQELRVVTRLQRDYEEVQQRLSDVERRIQSSQRGNLRTTLESMARSAQVKVESMEPQASPANEAYRETKVAVGLKAVTLAQTVTYLHQIEDAPQVLSIKSLRIRNRPDRSGLLDVNFTVSSFEPL